MTTPCRLGPTKMKTGEKQRRIRKDMEEFHGKTPCSLMFYRG